MSSEILALNSEKELLQEQLLEARQLLHITESITGFLDGQGNILKIHHGKFRLNIEDSQKYIGRLFWQCPWWSGDQKKILKVKNAFIQTLEQREFKVDLKFFNYSKSNSQSDWIWCELKMFLLDDEKDKIAFKISDISARVNAKIDLENQKSILDQIVSSGPASMALWVGEKLIIKKYNSEYRKIFPDRDLDDRPLEEAIPELKGQPFIDIIRKVYNTGKTYVGREMKAFLRASKDGPLQERYYDIVYTQIKDKDGNPYGVFDNALDVTERVKAQMLIGNKTKKLQELLVQLESERMTKERFFVGLSHDIRTPFSIVLSSAELLKELTEDKNIKKICEQIFVNTKRADAMIADVLNIGKLMKGEELSAKLVPTDLAQVCLNVIENLTWIYGDVFCYEGEPAHRVSCDPELLVRLIENLASNAVKYGDIKKPVTISCKKDGDKTALCVHNWGNPIPSEIQKSIFKMEFRAHNVKNKIEGWGVGLSLVKEITLAHKGKVKVRSSQKNGTSFKVVF